MENNRKTTNTQLNTMKILVQLYVSGTVIEEVVIAKNYEDGKKTALARNPTATVISATAIFT